MRLAPAFKVKISKDGSQDGSYFSGLDWGFDGVQDPGAGLTFRSQAVRKRRCRRRGRRCSPLRTTIKSHQGSGKLPEPGNFRRQPQGSRAMCKPMIFAITATLLFSSTSAPAVAQQINVLGAGGGWKLQSQRGPDGQNVYSYNCAADLRRISRHRVSSMARHTRIVIR